MLRIGCFKLDSYGITALSVFLTLVLGLLLRSLLQLEVSSLFLAMAIFSICFGTIAMFTDITKRKHTEAALRESEQRYRSLVEATSQIVWTTKPDGQVIDMPDWRAYTGQSQEEVQGWGWLEALHREDRERTARVWTQAVETRSIYDTEYRVRGADGNYRYFSARGVPVLTEAGSIREWVGVCSDITDRKQQEEALQKNEAIAKARAKELEILLKERKKAEAERDRTALLFRTLADTMPQMVWITRADGYHEYFNQRWYDYTGTTLEQTQGEGWQNILHAEDLQRTLEIWHNSLDTGTKYEIEYRLRRAADGEYRWHLGRALPLRDREGQIVRWFGSCTDIHDQKLAIEERAQALEREKAARLELEKAARLKDDFLAIVSHELRSPLNPILGWSKLLLSYNLDSTKMAQGLEIIERNAKLQANLIEDLLDISRILRGKLRLNNLPVDLVSIINQALETVHLSAEAKSIQIQSQFADNIGKVLGDPNRLQQVVWNLLANAVKFTPEEGQIAVCLQKVDNFAQIQVSDTGQGISADFLPHVFERFRQGDEIMTRKFGGLGLGLAIVRHLVELHGGTIEVMSPGEGLGTTFTVMLPLMKTDVQNS
jgi:PAS domain S-box-containing protein